MQESLNCSQQQIEAAHFVAEPLRIVAEGKTDFRDFFWLGVGNDREDMPFKNRAPQFAAGAMPVGGDARGWQVKSPRRVVVPDTAI